MDILLIACSWGGVEVIPTLMLEIQHKYNNNTIHAIWATLAKRGTIGSEGGAASFAI